MSEPIELMHIFRSGAPFVRSQALALISRLSRRRFHTTVAGELDARTKRRLAMSRARWVQMALPTDIHPLRQIGTARRLARLLSTQDTALVHAHGFQAAFTALLARRHLANGPVVICSPYGLPGLVQRSGLARQSVVTAARWVMREADVVVVQSDYEALQLGSLAPGKLDSLQVVPEGVVLESLREDFEPGAKRRLVGLDPMAAIVGVMAPPQGTGVTGFLEAARSVMALRPNVEFVSIGHGAKTEHFVEVAHQLGLSGCMVFVGERADIVEIIASLNALVIPADYSGARRYAVQALANNIPLIVAEDGGLPDVVSEIKQARTVPRDDVAGLEKAMAEFLDTVPARDTGELFDDELGFSQRELLVSGMVIDFDTVGLDPVPGRELSEAQEAIQRTIERFSMQQVARHFTHLYTQVATRQATAAESTG